MQENSCRYQNQVLVELTLLYSWTLFPSLFFCTLQVIAT